MVEVTVSSKGQIVLPKSIRETLGLNEGERIRLRIEGNEIVLTPVRSVQKGSWKTWRGALRGTHALKEHIAEHAEEVKD